MSGDEYIKRNADKIAENVRRIYEEGHWEGVKTAKEKYGAEGRGKAKRIPATDEQKEEYGEDLVGWCSECNKPINGRWAGMIDFCPWCGRVFVWGE